METDPELRDLHDQFDKALAALPEQFDLPDYPYVVREGQLVRTADADGANAFSAGSLSTTWVTDRYAEKSYVDEAIETFRPLELAESQRRMAEMWAFVAELEKRARLEAAAPEVTGQDHEVPDADVPEASGVEPDGPEVRGVGARGSVEPTVGEPEGTANPTTISTETAVESEVSDPQAGATTSVRRPPRRTAVGTLMSAEPAAAREVPGPSLLAARGSDVAETPSLDDSRTETSDLGVSPQDTTAEVREQGPSLDAGL